MDKRWRRKAKDTVQKADQVLSPVDAYLLWLFIQRGMDNLHKADMT